MVVMGQTATTEALPIWRSEAQPAVLYAAFYWNDATAARIASTFGLSPQQVGAEVHRLERAGLVRTHRVGRSAVISIDTDHPAALALRPLVDLTVGPLVDLAKLYELGGVDQVYVFGSWARRHRGEPGPPPRDLDVLVVGTVGRFDVEDACLAISGAHAIDVHPMVVTRAEFADPSSNAILAAIVDGELVEVRR